MTERPVCVYSIGHSNHDLERFLSLVSRHGIEVVADVRSSPWSRFAPQFNRETLERSLVARGVDYVFLGDRLGGRPEGDEFYDEEGHVLYSALAASELFESGIERLVREGRSRTVAIMCSEEDPTECHRRLLIGRVLSERCVAVAHIRGDGRLQAEDELAEAGPQQTLFAEEVPWRSTRSVSHRRRPATSSAG